MDRRTFLLSRIDPSTQQGLEIGALSRPIVPPDAGPVEYADHLSTAELREKYARNPRIDVEEIVPVSYVWGAETLRQSVGEKRFDYVIASHVIEHVPDLIGWFSDIASVLKPGGLLALVVPDKRWTFDCRRQVTSISALIESWLEQHRRPTIRHFIDHFGEIADGSATGTAALWGGRLAFDDVPLAHGDFFESLGEAGLREQHESFRRGEYIDTHCTVFTPYSFLRIVDVLARLGLFDFRVADFHETEKNELEFYVTLEKLPPDLGVADRRRAIVDSLPEIRAPLLDGEVEQLRTSLAWRIGAPFRALRKRFARRQ
jgi:SAM-dependent methyltransferase